MEYVLLLHSSFTDLLMWEKLLENVAEKEKT
jgi:hypothetical protein